MSNFASAPVTVNQRCRTYQLFPFSIRLIHTACGVTMKCDEASASQALHSQNSWRQRLQLLLSLPIRKDQPWPFLLLCLGVHAGLLTAIFDIYLSSPAVLSMTNYYRPNIDEPPAERLVLVVSDGLRAESFFENDMAATPFLKSVLKRGASGVSHTAVPTTSRLGHVALLAGTFEGVASMTPGWNADVVKLDHLFKRSSETFAWDTSHVVDLFDIPGKTFACNQQYCDTMNVAQAIQWTTRNLTNFFRTAKPQLADRLRYESGLIFFFHFSTTDPRGNDNQPDPLQFRKTLAEVDQAVSSIESQMEMFFNRDGRTAFLFTSDHGMTDWGSHGGADVSETSTPFLLWGAGVRRAAEQMDVAQNDLCPLMAALLGLPVPANNMGQLPLALMNVSAEMFTAQLRVNALQVMEHFEAKRALTKTASFFPPFRESPRLSPWSAQKRLREADAAMRSGRTARASEFFNQLIKDAIEAFDFFHRYDRTLHGLCIIAAFSLWILCLVIALLPEDLSEDVPPSGPESAAFLFLISFQALLLLIEARSPLYWCYRITPVVLLWSVYQHRQRLARIFISREMTTNLLLAFAGIQLIVCGFYHRSLFAITVLLNTFWQMWSKRGAVTASMIVFIIGSLVIAIFPLLPAVNGNVFLDIVPIGPFVTSMIVLALLGTKLFRDRISRVSLTVLVIQLSLTFISILTHLILCSKELQRASKEDAAINEAIIKRINWCAIVFGLLIPTCMCLTDTTRVALISLVLSIATIHTLLSIAHETIFFLYLFITVSAWVAMETEERLQSPSKNWTSIFLLRPHLFETKDTQDATQTLRQRFFLVLFIYLAFFGTGNIVSVTSFNQSLHSCFTIEGGLYLSTFLMLLKISLPMLLVTILFSVQVANLPICHLMMQTMILTDILALQFFVQVRDRGNWEVIGASISHFVISTSVSLLLAILLFVVRLLLRKSFIYDEMWTQLRSGR